VQHGEGVQHYQNVQQVQHSHHVRAAHDSQDQQQQQQRPAAHWGHQARRLLWRRLLLDLNLKLLQQASAQDTDIERLKKIQVGNHLFLLLPYQGGGLPPAGHTQRNQANPTAGGPTQSLTSEIRPRRCPGRPPGFPPRGGITCVSCILLFVFSCIL
jgi:hypothetical protein